MRRSETASPGGFRRLLMNPPGARPVGAGDPGDSSEANGQRSRWPVIPLKDPCQDALCLVLPDESDATLGKHCRRQRYDRAVRMSQYLINDAMTGDGSERGSAMRAKNDEVGLLGAALVKQFLCRITGHDDGLDGDATCAVPGE